MSNSEQNNSWADIAAHHKDKGGNKQRATDPSLSASSTTNPEQRVPSIDDAPGGSSNNFPLPQETVKDKSPSSSGVSDLLNQSGELIAEEEANNTLSPERSYAFVSDFSSPQEAARREKAKSPTPSHTSSSGVGDLLNNNNNNKEHKANKEDTTIPPHPARSFANVAGNKDFPNMPAPEENTLSSSTDSLSDLPDVKEMLSSPSVKVPPPPASQSFAKMAAKPAPVEEKPSERLEAIEQQNRQHHQQQKDALPQHTHDDFPTLQQANQMAENNVDHAQPKERAMFTEISKLSEAVDAAAADRPQEDTTTAPNDVKASFASVTGSNLDMAPPSASPQPVPQQPVFDEETVMLENARREIRRWRQKEPGEEITPEMKPMEEQREERIKEHEAETVGPAELEQRVQFFDKSKRGKITIWDTFKALRGLGYSCLTALPATFLLHLRLSPLTSPYRFPFFYRSISDLLTLPIYVNRVPAALTIGSPLLGGQRSHELVRKYGSETTTTQGKSMRGLGFWAGMRGIGACENLRWWQFAPRIIHRLQWFMIYTMLQDPQSHLVSEGVLASLPSSSSA